MSIELADALGLTGVEKTPLTVADESRIELWSGAVYVFPAGWHSIVDMGPFLSLERWSVLRQMWVPTRHPSTGLIPVFYSTGSNYRVANRVHCVQNVRINNGGGGSGYSSATPPVVADGQNHRGRPPQFRCIVGGAVAFTITHGGKYDYAPTFKFDYSQQTPPIRPITISPSIDAVTGAITAIRCDSNDGGGAFGSTSGYSGAGINVATLGLSIIRHPNDTQTDDATITMSAAGAGAVTAVDCIDHGSEINGNNDFTAVITHNGGSGLNVSIMGNCYVTGFTIQDTGDYRDASNNPITSDTTNNTYLGLVVYGGIIGDEGSRPIVNAGVGTLTGGALTGVSLTAVGPFFQVRPKIACVYSGPVPPVRNAQVKAILSAGGDYFTYQKLR
jgi:hypothetical protein